ncbi:uncharacterized protein LOC111323908 isoform X2 [Stylophora pistillata]|uniref:Low-density lipoprotein receptor-related protein 6 n=1 Tax=Stylophora pistillata TaxID=50429 RepID=A0A2B4SMA9_STYPI|nr:uncharacterized protein LOC111323908 isoform X2 [Stylophora pistillata]PFX30203.1 Low-density lipoprotein receptor-related protein 6 [Stylophora pistillata]
MRVGSEICNRTNLLNTSETRVGSAVMLRIFTIFAGAVVLCFAQEGNNTQKGRSRGSTVFLQVPQDIHYYVTRNQSVNLTWVADNVCKIQIKCAGKKFKEGDTGLCGKSCKSCRKRKKTRIVTLADFPKKIRTITCQCKVWAIRPVRTEKIILEKAYLRRNFGKVPPCQVASLNSTVVLPCAPPVGSPPANVTWYKIGESSSLFRNKGRRRVRSGRLIIKRSRVGDSGEYRCVAQNIAARREGPVIRVVVGERPMLLVGSEDAFYLSNTSNRRRIKAENVVSFDFSWEENWIFWSDKKSIKELSMHDGISRDTPFLYDDVGSVKGLSVDWEAKKLYWIDGQKNAIYVGDPQRKVKVKIIDNVPDSATLESVAVSHSKSFLYWTSSGGTPKIERARLDGSERKVLINNSVHFPNGLAIDESDKKLYWAGTDSYNYGIIEAVSLEGLSRTVLLYRRGFHPTALTFYQNFVYWSDSKKNAVLRLSCRGGESIVVSGLRNPTGVKIFHNRIGISVPATDSCLKDNGQCDHLCLYLPFRGRHKCLCEENFVLDENGKHCRKRVPEIKSTSTRATHSSHTVILSIVILLLVVMGIIYCAVRVIQRGCPCQRSQDVPRMPRQSNEQGEDLLAMIDQSELENTGSQTLNESSNLLGQDCSGEPSGSEATCEDSSQASPKDLVFYVQPGGVAIVGDDAQLHLHSSSPVRANPVTNL